MRWPKEAAYALLLRLNLQVYFTLTLISAVLPVNLKPIDFRAGIQILHSLLLLRRELLLSRQSSEFE